MESDYRLTRRRLGPARHRQVRDRRRDARAPGGGSARAWLKRAEEDGSTSPGVGSGAGRRIRPAGAVLRAAPWLVLSSLLAACGGPPPGAGEAATRDATDLTMADLTMGEAPQPAGGEVADREADTATAAERLAIIVNLAVGPDPAAEGDAGDDTDDTLANVTARVMERLQAVMSAEDFAEVRTFGFLPAIALSADGALIARLLAMPEVQSIELDRELEPLGGAATDLRLE